MYQILSAILSILPIPPKLTSKEAAMLKKPQTNKPLPRPLGAEPLEERLPVSASILGVAAGAAFSGYDATVGGTEYRSTATSGGVAMNLDVLPDLWLDALTDSVQEEKSLDDAISSALADPFTLTPLTAGTVLDDTMEDPHRALGDELLLFQISTLDPGLNVFERIEPVFERITPDQINAILERDLEDPLKPPSANLTRYGYSPIANDLQDEKGDEGGGRCGCGPGSCCCGTTWSVACVNISEKQGGAKIIPGPTHCGLAIFPEKVSPTQGGTLWKELLITVSVVNPDPVNAMTVSLGYLDVYNWLDSNSGNTFPTGSPGDNNGPIVYTNSSTGTICPTSSFLSMPSTVTIPAGQYISEPITVTINQAHAGDNWVFTGKGAGNTIAIQSELLTIWRTLWVELDRMYDTLTNNLAEAFPPGIFGTGGIIATQLARACVVPKEFTGNSVEFVPGLSVIDDADEDTIRGVIGFPPYRSAPLGLEEFWTVQLVNAFRRKTKSNDNPPVITYDSPVGSHRHNLYIVYVDSIDAKLAGEGISNQFDTIYSIVVLHEIGHALWLDDVKDAQGNKIDPLPGVTYGVMLGKGDLGFHLVNDNDKFTKQNLKDIQAMGVPEAGSGWNHPK